MIKAVRVRSAVEWGTGTISLKNLEHLVYVTEFYEWQARPKSVMYSSSIIATEWLCDGASKPFKRVLFFAVLRLGSVWIQLWW